MKENFIGKSVIVSLDKPTPSCDADRVSKWPAEVTSLLLTILFHGSLVTHDERKTIVAIILVDSKTDSLQEEMPLAIRLRSLHSGKENRLVNNQGSVNIICKSMEFVVG